MRSARLAVAVPLLSITACATAPRDGLDRAEVDRLFETGEFRRVAELCTGRLEESPADFYAFEARAWALFQAGAEDGEWAEADREAILRDCATMEELAPDSISPWLLRAFMADYLRKALDVWDEGIRCVEAAGGDATQLRYFRARDLFRLRRDEGALADCRRALAGLDAKLGPEWTGPAEFAQRAELRWWLAASETDPEHKRKLERGAEADEARARNLGQEKGYPYSPIRSPPRGPELIDIRINDHVRKAEPAGPPSEETDPADVF